MAWEHLTSENQLNNSWELSNKKAQLFFKHSTRCNISTMALNRFEGSGILNNEAIECYYLDLLNYRDLSNLIAEKSGVQHQSPQVIVIRNGEVIYSESHGMINGREIEKMI
ncbi:MAG: bacillithiol system redox-active protein YtxJ [Crocinitomicaceae bacterium]|nr:bacillithiol system redox-active protein YtxJ [Crocinitomicaceae bacterium]